MADREHSKIPSDLQHGVVVMFNAERGFGFIRPDGAREDENRDVFVHVRNVAGRKTLHAGQRASYFLTRTDKGLAAINVQAGSPFSTPYLRYVLIGLGTALLLLFAFAFALDRPASLALWLVMWVAAISIATFGIYGYDKAQAQGSGVRVPEVVLHLLGALGGTPGAFVGIRLFRHKTSKSQFQVIFWLIVAAQLGILIWWWLNRQGA